MSRYSNTEEKAPLEPPPPYTPEDETSEFIPSSNNNRSTQQQQADTVYEQSGLPDQLHSSNIDRVSQSKIGGIIGLTANLIQPFKANPQPSAIATGLVGGIINHYVERKENIRSRKNLKREQRQERRKLRREQRGLRKYDGSGESISNSSPSSPSSPSSSSSSSSFSNLSAYQMTDENKSSRSTENNNVLCKKQSNSPLIYEHSWSGHKCELQTSNGHIEVQGSLIAKELIDLNASNGHITVDGELHSSEIHVNTSNGCFRVNGTSLIAQDKLMIKISNAPLTFDNTLIQSKRIELTTKNGPVFLRHVKVKDMLSVITSNASVNVYLDEMGDHAKIFIETSNAPIAVHLPKTFSGYFELKSNSSGSASVITSQSDGMLTLNKDKHCKKSGTYNRHGVKTDIEVYIETTNASAVLYI
ncbi:uncharacterized protein BX663DRAFT_525111 [Cokeromyces recurvatus]|uniref:uncharacterized protein n=1 Tax=Cokeromyces recurvatus TaxID=90255 RepID=UPI002220FEA7|nr:uncharacterized protein BX663DRAFT_525111 [Cokeromyces recurvatus]KAI7898379.1 hypothetical protein BX663DRAFT_525111 [Cokeromyces recurvatus]